MKLTAAIPLACLCALLVSCSNRVAEERRWRRSFPFLAVTSPTAFPFHRATPTDAIPAEWSHIPAALDIPILRTVIGWFTKPGFSQEARPETLPLKQALTDYKLFLETSPYKTATSIDFDGDAVDHPRCFGPALEFNGEALAQDSVGILSPTEPPGTGNEACAAAQMNYLVRLAGAANAAVRLVSILSGTVHERGIQIPSSDQAVDIAAFLPRIGKNITVTKARLRQLKSATGETTYSTRVELEMTTDHGPQMGALTGFHLPTTPDGTGFRGVVQLLLPQSIQAKIQKKTETNTPAFKAMSMAYESDGSRLTYLLEMAQTTAATATPGAVFSAAHRVRFDTPSFQSEGYRYLATLNQRTGEGMMKIAWMDSAKDTATRVFEVKVSRKSTGPLEGFAYFGFGDTLAIMDETQVHWIQKFLPSVTSQNAVPNRCQGQTFSQTTIDGPFVSTEFHGPFIPSTTGTGSGLISGNADFNGTLTIQTLDLIPVGAYGDIQIPVPRIDIPLLQKDT